MSQIKQTITIYNNDVLNQPTNITRVVRDGVARYQNKMYLVHEHYGEPSINTEDPIRTSIDLFDDDVIIRQAKNILNKRCIRGSFLESPESVMDLCIMELAKEQSEVYGLIVMDQRHRVLAILRLFYGSVASCTVHTRSIIQSVLKYNAASAVIFHSHPSSFLEPSRADLQIGERIKKALDYCDCRLIDSIIVGGGNAISLAQRGEF